MVLVLVAHFRARLGVNLVCAVLSSEVTNETMLQNSWPARPAGLRLLIHPTSSYCRAVWILEKFEEVDSVETLRRRCP